MNVALVLWAFDFAGGLKLEFDVWQQNDASEFSTKLLDRLETSLKKWAPDDFHFLDHTINP